MFLGTICFVEYALLHELLPWRMTSVPLEFMLFLVFPVTPILSLVFRISFQFYFCAVQIVVFSMAKTFWFLSLSYSNCQLQLRNALYYVRSYVLFYPQRAKKLGKFDILFFNKYFFIFFNFVMFRIFLMSWASLLQLSLIHDNFITAFVRADFHLVPAETGLLSYNAKSFLKPSVLFSSYFEIKRSMLLINNHVMVYYSKI